MRTEIKKEGPAAEIPIHEKLFTFGPDGAPKLICSRCRECGGTFYPTEAMCPSCIKEETVDTIEIDGKGKIVSFTKVMKGPPGYDSPYVLACLELDEGPSVIAQLQDWQDVDLAIDMPVELVIGRIKKEKNGTTVIGPKFRPLPK